MTVDLQKAKAEAKEEVEKEEMDKAKRKYKGKMHELKNAKKIVRNIERELEDLDDELSQD